MINVEHVYQMNIIAPYRQEKSTLIEGKYKDPQSPYKNHKVRWRTRYGNMRWITTKQTRGLIFDMQNSLLLTCSWPTEEIFQLHGQNRLMENLPAVDFRSQPREMPVPKPLNT